MRVLICDDEPAMVEILKRHLRSVSSVMDSSDTLEDALRMVNDNPYNLVILDLKLRLTGKQEALQAIRNFKMHKCVVIVVSGLPEPHLKEEVLGAGADEFLAKDGSFNARSLLLAASIATLKLPRDAYKSDTFSAHVQWLSSMAESFKSSDA